MLHTKAQYDAAMQRLDDLLNAIGEDEAHPLLEELEPLSDQIMQYEETHFPVPVSIGAVDTLAALLAERDVAGQRDPAQTAIAVSVCTTLEDCIAKADNKTAWESAVVLAEMFNVAPTVFLPQGFEQEKEVV